MRDLFFEILKVRGLEIGCSQSYFFSKIQNSILMSLACHKKSYFICIQCSNFQILRNIYLFPSSCLCPVGCLSFVSWKKSKKILRNISKIQKFDTYQIAFLMTCQRHKNKTVSFCTGLFFSKNSTKVFALFHTVHCTAVHLLKSWIAKNTGSRKQIITQKLFLVKHNISFKCVL